MAIITPLTYTIANGQAVDATPLMADLNQIVTDVNANAAAVNGDATQTFNVDTATTATEATPLAQVQSLISASTGGVSSFNTRTGAVTLESADVTGALGFTPANISGNAAQTFAVANSTADSADAVPRSQADTLYAAAGSSSTSPWLNILTYGLTASGFSSAASAAGFGVAVVPDGNTVTLGGAVTGGATTFLTLGSTYTDPTNLPGATDTSVFGKSGAIWTKDFGIAGGGGTTTNEFVMALQGIAKTSTGSATGPYEKAILYVNGRQDDATNYASNYLFDLANVESIVTANNTNTRMWGYHALVQFPSGTGGFGLGFDSEMHNPSGELASGITDQQKGKWAYATEAAEGTITGGLVLIGGSPYTTGQFQYGIAMYPRAVISGNPSVVIPNACPISAWNSAGTGVINCLYANASGDVVVGNNATSVSITPGLNALGGVNTTNLTLTGATPGGSGTTYTITLGGTVAHSASAGINGAVPFQVQGYLEFAANGTIYKIPYFNN